MVRQAAVTHNSLILCDTLPQSAAISSVAACKGCALAWGQNALSIAGICLPRAGSKGSKDILRLLPYARGDAVRILLQRLSWQGGVLQFRVCGLAGLGCKISPSVQARLSA